MRIAELKFIVPLMYLVCHAVIAGAGESTVCPGHDALVPSEKVIARCKQNMPKSMADCTRLVDEFSNLESPTTQQKYDLASAMRELSEYTHRTKTLELNGRVEKLHRSLQEDHPDDISLLFDQYKRMDIEERLLFLFRILEIAPDCSDVRNRLVHGLGFHRAYRDDPALSDNRRGVISYQLGIGYRLADEKVWKLRFGQMMFNSDLDRGSTANAKRIQEDILRELDVAHLSYDGASRTENLEAICDEASLRLRFTKYCLDGIEQSLEHDISTGRPLGDDVLQAIKRVSVALTFRYDGRGYGELDHPSNVKEFDFREYPLFRQEAAKYAIRLDDMVRAVPVELQSLALYHAMIDVLGKDSKLKMLEGLLLAGADNVEISGLISEIESD